MNSLTFLQFMDIFYTNYVFIYEFKVFYGVKFDL